MSHQEIVERMRSRFTSTNSVPVERAHLTAQEWAEVAAALKEAERERYEAILDGHALLERAEAERDAAEAQLTRVREALASVTHRREWTPGYPEITHSHVHYEGSLCFLCAALAEPATGAPKEPRFPYRAPDNSGGSLGAPNG
jgi:hypothetical protein